MAAAHRPGVDKDLASRAAAPTTPSELSDQATPGGLPLHHDIDGIRFPLYSARAARCAEPDGVADGKPLCRRLANNVLFIRPPPDLVPGWRVVPAGPRWNAWIDGEAVAWRPHDVSLQPREHRRWWGMRDHVRVWSSPDQGHAIGQAHREVWRRWPRRHKVISLDAARQALLAAILTQSPTATIDFVDVGSQGPDHDGRVAIVRW